MWSALLAQFGSSAADLFEVTPGRVDDFARHTTHGDRTAADPGRHAPTLAYVEKPAHRTRTELLADRRKRNLPPLAYDLDNDGCAGARRGGARARRQAVMSACSRRVVDNIDYFISRCIDKNRDGTLSESERQSALELRANMSKHFLV